MKYLTAIIFTVVLLSSCVKEDIKPRQDIEQEKSKERGITIDTTKDSTPKK